MRLLVTLFITSVLISLQAQARMSCVSLFYRQNNSAPNLGKALQSTDIDLVDRSYLVSPENANPHFPSQTKTLETPQFIIDPQLNTPVVLIQRIGPTWASMYTPLKPNYAGDPRWNAVILSPDSSYYFGFRKLSENAVTAPTADYANAKIDLINLKMPDKYKIKIKFRETGDDPIARRTYLNDFLVHNRLPLAQKGHYFIHDISYHFSSILLPESVILKTKKRIRLILDLDLQAKKLLKQKQLSKQAYEAVREELLRRVVMLDTASGFFGWVMAQLHVAGREWPINDYYKYVQDSFFKNNTSALAETITRLQARVNNPEDKQKLAELAQSVATPADLQIDQLTHEQFFSEVQQRRAKINEILADSSPF